jgi:hypothetical protein
MDNCATDSLRHRYGVGRGAAEYLDIDLARISGSRRISAVPRSLVSKCVSKAGC